MSQIQAPREEVGHQSVKMATCVFSNYPVILVGVVLRRNERGNTATSYKPVHCKTAGKYTQAFCVIGKSL